jgi:type I restriction enzyme S subunit
VKFVWKEIGHHLEKVDKWNPAKAYPDDKFTYIDLSSVDKNNKKINLSGIQNIDCTNAPSRARQLVKNSDILVSTVRPNLNGVAIVPSNLDGATASTGYCVLRTDKKILSSRYLFYWVQTIPFISDMMSKATGANYPAVSDKTIKKSKIPLPSLAKQKKITTILDAANQLRQKDQQLIDHYTHLSQSLFLEMFGDPVINSMGWNTILLADVGTLGRGKSKHRPRNDPKLLGGEHPLIQTGDVANSGGYITKFKSTYSDTGLAQSKMWSVGTLCITIAANIAKTGILTFDACFPDSVVGFKNNEKTNIEFIQYWLSFLQKILEETAPMAAQKNINLKILKELEIPLPPIELQNQFAQQIEKIEQQKQYAQASLKKSETLFNSLLQQAFKGELTQSHTL